MLYYNKAILQLTNWACDQYCNENTLERAILYTIFSVMDVKNIAVKENSEF